MSVKGKKHLSMMMALCQTIVEGAEHLAAYKGDKFLKPDTITGLCTLEVSLESFGAYTSMKVTKLLKACIENDIYLHDKEFLSILQYWHSSVSKTIRTLWTTEALRCPLCDSPGLPAYTASVYLKNDDDISIDFDRLWMKCACCKNYFVVKSSTCSYFNAPENDDYPEADSLIAYDEIKYRDMAAAVTENIKEGFVLFAGERTSSISYAFSYDNYIFHSCTLSQLENLAENNLFRGRYHAVLIENLSDSTDVKSVLENALSFLADDGILWFDVPDFEAKLQRLGRYGDVLPELSGTDVLLLPQGVEALKKALSYYVIGYKKVLECEMIEFLLGKKNYDS